MIVRAVSRALPFALVAWVCGCAWTNRDNRPVWNAFEEHLVPEGDAAFYASLPLTVPAGFGAIVTDTFVVHPVQVMDDAWCDAADLWDDLDWQTQYYTELAILPFRGVATPLVLGGSFLARSAFDIAPYGRNASARELPKRAAPAEPSLEERQLEARALLVRVSAREDHRLLINTLRQLEWPPWSPSLDQAWEQAITRGSAEMRRELFDIARRHELPPWRADPVRGLRDSSAVVRYQELRELPAEVTVPPDLSAALLRDPEEAVRDRARTRWPEN